jgi:hypothetical protein
VSQLIGVRESNKRTKVSEIALSLTLLFVISASAQPSETTKKSSLHPRAITLDTILSCTNDPLIAEVFKTDEFTARFKLFAVSMIEMKYKTPGPSYDALSSKGFVTRPLDDTSLEIIPTDPLSGKIATASNLSFCHSSPTARYSKSGDKSEPLLIEIRGNDWLFDPTEIFVHADQFRFDSGIFADSSDVFFTAIKGRVSIQFICKTNGLKFYRAIYTQSD